MSPLAPRRLVVLFAIALACGAAPSTALGVEQVRFDFTGAEQFWTVPAGVSSLQVEAVGGRGGTGSEGGGAGGSGALVTGELNVTPGQVFFIEVGGNGGVFAPAAFNGGGAGAQFGAGGGGATDLRTVTRTGEPSITLASRLLVAAGGGGGGGESGGAAGGDAGMVGGDATDASPQALGGDGGDPGTGSAGGEGGAGGKGEIGNGEAGDSGLLAEGGDSNGNIAGGGGAGGGGLFGGGAGGTGGRSGAGVNAGGGGGGGGSSLVPGGGTFAVAGQSVESHLTIAYTVVPTALLGTSTALAPTRALLLGSAEGLGGLTTTHFEYGTDMTYGSSTPESSPALTVFASAVVTGLEPGTTYHYRLVATRAGGGVGRSPDGTLTTPFGVRPVLRLLRSDLHLDHGGRVALRLRCSKGEQPCQALLAARWVGAGLIRRTLTVKPGTLRTVRFPAPPAIQQALMDDPVAQLHVSVVGLGRTKASPPRRTLTIRP